MRLIACEYDDYSASGGLDDAVTDSRGHIAVFDDEEQCLSFIHSNRKTPYDSLDLWDVDSLVLIASYRSERKYGDDHKLKSFRYVKQPV